MKILAVGDFHGKFLIKKEFLQKNKIDIIISQGDFPSSEKIRDLIFGNWKRYRKGETLEEIVGKKQWKKMLKDDIESQQIVLKKLDSLNIPVFIVFGNAEHRNEIEKFLKKSKNIKYISSKKIKFNGYYFVGIDCASNETPHRMQKNLEKIKKLATNIGPLILLTHEPPFNTEFDIVRNKESPKDGEHVGSKFVRKIIMESKPLLNVFGHMHEYFGKQKFGKTLLVCAGYGHDGQATIINLNNEIKIELVNLEKNS
jgi:hypothetical protein